jgi:hypothetical protein
MTASKSKTSQFNKRVINTRKKLAEHAINLAMLLSEKYRIESDEYDLDKRKRENAYLILKEELAMHTIVCTESDG